MATSTESGRRLRPMNVYVRRGSKAEDKYRVSAGVPGLLPEVIAPGIPPTPKHDLLYHGGKTIQSLTFTNFYVGADAWNQSDIQNIDHALAAAMTDPHLNNVMAQYFAAVPTSTFKPSQKLPGAAPAHFSQGDVEQLISSLHTQGKLAGFDLSSTVFNFMLPPATVLNDNPAPGGAQGVAAQVHRRGCSTGRRGRLAARLGRLPRFGPGWRHNSLLCGRRLFRDERRNDQRNTGIRYAVEKCRSDVLPRTQRGADRSGRRAGDQRRSFFAARMGIETRRRVR